MNRAEGSDSPINMAFSSALRRVRSPAIQSAFRASLVEGSTFALSQALRLVSSMILTRVLLPEAFGVMAMLSLLLYGLHMLSDVGILQAVVRSPRGEDPAFLHTAFSIQALRGVWLWLTASALAWPLALLFREPSLVWIVPVGALGALLDGMASLRSCLLLREMRPLSLGFLELGAQVCGAAVTLVSAGLLELGVWSLVAGTLASGCVQTLGSHLLPHSHRDGFRWEPAARQEIFQFGRWIFASSAVTFLAGRGDQLMLGRILGASNLGLYNIAASLADLPEGLAQRFIRGVLYPVYARVFNERPADIMRVYYRSRLAFDALMQTAIGGLYAMAPWLIGLLYDARYQSASIMLQVLALRSALTLMAVPCESVLTAGGLGKYGFRANVTLAASVLVLLPVGYVLAGAEGVLWATVASRASALATLWHGAKEQGVLRFKRELVAPLAIAAGYLLGKGALWLLGALTA